MVETNFENSGDTTDRSLALGIAGFSFNDLFDPERLAALSDSFDTFANKQNPNLFSAFDAYRRTSGSGLTPPEISELLVRMAPYVADFIARLFHVEEQRAMQIAGIKNEMDTVFAFRSEIVADVAKKYRRENAADWDTESLSNQLRLLLEKGFPESEREYDLEYRVAAAAIGLRQSIEPEQSESEGSDTLRIAITDIRNRLSMDDFTRDLFKDALAEETPSGFAQSLLELIERWVYAAFTIPDFVAEVKDWVSFKSPQKTDFAHLVEVETHCTNGFERLMGPGQDRRRRDGFALTDPRYGKREVLYEVDHCIYCHDRDNLKLSNF